MVTPPPNIMSSSNTELQEIITSRQHGIFVFTLALVACIFGYFFSVSDHLAGFSDDSATYLIMSEVLSPYPTDIPESFIRSYTEYRQLSPGFPLILAATGANSSLYMSHILILIEFCLSILAMAVFYTRSISGRALSLAPLIIFLLLPGVWFELLKIMSENQYLLLTMIFLSLSCARKNIIESRHGYLIFLGLLASSIYLTRSIGVALYMAFIIHVILANKRRTLLYAGKLSSFTIGFLLPILFWKYLQPQSGTNYLSDFLYFTTQKNPVQYYYLLFSDNLSALLSAWASTIMIYWQHVHDLRFILTTSLLPIVFAGFFVRIGKIDSIYVAIYLSILMIWPYPAEMKRFLYPIFPIFLLYLIIGIKWLTERFRRRDLIRLVSIFTILAISVPSFAYILKRHSISSELPDGDLSHSISIYKNPDLSTAVSISETWGTYMYLMHNLSKTCRTWHNPTQHETSICNTAKWDICRKAPAPEK